LQVSSFFSPQPILMNNLLRRLSISASTSISTPIRSFQASQTFISMADQSNRGRGRGRGASGSRGSARGRGSRTGGNSNPNGSRNGNPTQQSRFNSTDSTPAASPAPAASGTSHLSTTSFKSLSIDPRILASIPFDLMTEVQAQTLQPALSGNDLLAQARTGTGKTLAL